MPNDINIADFKEIQYHSDPQGQLDERDQVVETNQRAAQALHAGAIEVKDVFSDIHNLVDMARKDLKQLDKNTFEAMRSTIDGLELIINCLSLSQRNEATQEAMDYINRLKTIGYDNYARDGSFYSGLTSVITVLKNIGTDGSVTNEYKAECRAIRAQINKILIEDPHYNLFVNTVKLDDSRLSENDCIVVENPPSFLICAKQAMLHGNIKIMLGKDELRLANIDLLEQPFVLQKKINGSSIEWHVHNTIPKDCASVQATLSNFLASGEDGFVHVPGGVSYVSCEREEKGVVHARVKICDAIMTAPYGSILPSLKGFLAGVFPSSFPVWSKQREAKAAYTTALHESAMLLRELPKLSYGTKPDNSFGARVWRFFSFSGTSIDDSAKIDFDEAKEEGIQALKKASEKLEKAETKLLKAYVNDNSLSPVGERFFKLMPKTFSWFFPVAAEFRNANNVRDIFFKNRKIKLETITDNEKVRLRGFVSEGYKTCLNCKPEDRAQRFYLANLLVDKAKHLGLIDADQEKNIKEFLGEEAHPEGTAHAEYEAKLVDYFKNPETSLQETEDVFRRLARRIQGTEAGKQEIPYDLDMFSEYLNQTEGNSFSDLGGP